MGNLQHEPHCLHTPTRFFETGKTDVNVLFNFDFICLFHISLYFFLRGFFSGRQKDEKAPEQGADVSSSGLHIALPPEPCFSYVYYNSE